MELLLRVILQLLQSLRHVGSGQTTALHLDTGVFERGGLAVAENDNRLCNPAASNILPDERWLDTVRSPFDDKPRHIFFIHSLSRMYSFRTGNAAFTVLG